jgi:putative peptidoglycan lipid II flippase
MPAHDTTRTIQHSALKFFSGTLLSRISGYARDIALAYSFGTEPALAAFLVAFRFAHLARRLFGEGSLQNLFVPHFEELRAKDSPAAFGFFRDLTLSLTLIVAALIIAGLLILYPFRGHEVVSLTMIMLPSLLFVCLFGLNAALMTCEKHFFVTGAAPIAFNAAWIAAALMLAHKPAEEAVMGLSLAVVAACFLQWAVTLPQTLKDQTFSFWIQAKAFTPQVKKLGKMLFFANLGVAATQINSAIDPLFALYASDEGPAMLWYAIRIQQLPLALFGIALSSALLPPLSRAIHQGKEAEAAQFFRFAFKRCALLTLPITAALFVLSPFVISLLFGYGAFQQESIEGSARCLMAYGVGLFPMALLLIQAPALYAFGDVRTPVQASIASLVINAALNALFIFGWGLGPESVALATSFAAMVNCYLLHRKLQHCFLKDSPPVR